MLRTIDASSCRHCTGLRHSFSRPSEKDFAASLGYKEKFRVNTLYPGKVAISNINHNHYFYFNCFYSYSCYHHFDYGHGNIWSWST